MSDNDLLALKKVGVEAAARYLQNGTTVQDIRVQAQAGISPFCKAIRKTPGSSKFTYRINIGLLMAFKHGELGLQ